MAEVAEQTLKAGVKVTSATVDAMVRFLEAIAKMADDRAKTAAKREMAKWIKGGGGLVSKELQGSVRNEVLAQARLKGIDPIVNPRDGALIIRDCDEATIDQINREVLIKRSNYYQEVPAPELEDAVARSQKGSKDMFRITGLDPLEAECLKRKCNDVSRGFMVGAEPVDPETGKCSLTLINSKVCEYNPKGTDFCEAALRAAFSQYGPNKDIKEKQIKNDMAMKDRIAELRVKDGTHWLVSEFNPNEYIEFNRNKETGKLSFEYKRRTLDKESGKYVLQPEMMLDTDDPDFEVELARCTDRIKNKILLDDEAQFEKYTNGDLKETSDRLNKSKDQLAISRAEDKFTDKINLMVKDKYIERVKSSELTSQEKFETYRKGIKEIVSAMKDGEIPSGYKDEDVQELYDILEEGGTDINHYKDAIDHFSGLQVEMYKAEKHSKEEMEQAKKDYRENGRGTAIDREEDEPERSR